MKDEREASHPVNKSAESQNNFHLFICSIAFQRESAGTGATMLTGCFNTGWMNSALRECRLMPPSGLEQGKAVFQVAFDRASHLGKLATDLVMTACLQVYSQQIIVVRASNHFIMQDCFLGIRPFRVISIALILLLVANQPVHQLSLFCRRTVLHDRPIGLLLLRRPGTSRSDGRAPCSSWQITRRH